MILAMWVFVFLADLKRCELKEEDDRRKGDYFQLQVLVFSILHFFFLVTFVLTLNDSES